MALIPLKYIVLSQVFLAVWAVFEAYLGLTFLFGNLVLFALGLWAVIAKTDTDAFFLYAITYIWCFVTDLFVVGRKTDDLGKIGDQTSEFKFSFAMALLLIFYKVVCFWPLWQEHNSRGAAHVEGSAQAPLSHGAYDPIPPQRMSRADGGGYDPNATAGVSGVAPTVGVPSSGGAFMGQPQAAPVMGVVGSGNVAAGSGFQQGGYNT